jgi:hypothetical protein
MRAEWFTNPRLDGPTPFTITAEGQVYGHLCTWQTCHLSYQHECVQPPHHYRGNALCDICGRAEDTPNHSQAEYRYFLLGEVQAGRMGVDVGQVTFRTGHAPLKVGAKGATAHYDDTGTCGADVRCGEDEHGCWLAGAVRSLDEDCLREFRGAKLSGDWRAIQGRLELVGILSVNVPGFPVPRARIASSPHTHALALVAGGSPVDTSLVDQQAAMHQLRVASGIHREQLHRSVS